MGAMAEQTVIDTRRSVVLPDGTDPVAVAAATARNAGKLTGLTALGATETVVLDGSPDAAEQLGQAGRDTDVVIDYLWGKPAADALYTIIPARADDGQQLTWLQIGSVAGSTSPIPSAARARYACRSSAAGRARSAPRHPRRAARPRGGNWPSASRWAVSVPSTCP